MITLRHLQTYDPCDITTTGYDVYIRDDGTMRLVSHSRWQGSTDGEVWLVATPPEIAEALELEGTPESEDAPDVDTAVADWLLGADPSTWKRIRTGHKVQ